MKKKLLTIISSLTLGIMCFNSSFVYATTNESIQHNEVEKSTVKDITDDPNYLVNKGQISLEDMNISIDNSGVVLKAKSRSLETERSINELNKRMSNDPSLESFLMELIQKGAKISDIGYTETYVKTTESGKRLPVKKDEVLKSPRADIGEWGTKEKLTLYTFVEPMLYEGDLYVSAYSPASWSGWGPIGSMNYSGPAPGDDYISITVPQRYVTTFKSFWGAYELESLGEPKHSCVTDDEHNLVYAFEELKMLTGVNKRLDWVRIATGAKTKYTEERTEKFTSSYVHTYDKITISPSVDASGGLSFGISSSDDAWQISSSVVTKY